MAANPSGFSHPDWIFEIKLDGFRALARIEHGRCKLISRNGNEFKSFRTLNDCIGSEVAATTAVLDGEIVALVDQGKPDFKALLFRPREPRFAAFDLLYCDGEDLRYAPLSERKHKLRSIFPTDCDRLHYCDHLQQDGERLFRFACEQDLEGIIAKRRFEDAAQHST